MYTSASESTLTNK